jgi:hypothetical protein
LSSNLAIFVGQSLRAIFSLLSHGSGFLLLSESGFADFVCTGDMSKAHTKLAEP